MLNIKKIGSVVVESNVSVFIGKRTNKMQISQTFYLKDANFSISWHRIISASKILNEKSYWI